MRGLIGLVVTLLLILFAVWLVVELAEIAVAGPVFLVALAVIGAIALIGALMNRTTIA